MQGTKDCVSIYAKKRGITYTQAEEEFKTALEVICESCEKHKGVNFRGIFSIKKVIKKATSGTINGIPWDSPQKNKLIFKTGKDLSERINS